MYPRDIIVIGTSAGGLDRVRRGQTELATYVAGAEERNGQIRNRELLTESTDGRLKPELANVL